MNTDQTPDNSASIQSKPQLQQTLQRASRRAKLLNAATQVSRIISSILDPDELLSRTVDIICDEYGFYYSGIFLIETLDDGKEWAVLKAGRGKAGRLMIKHKHKLEVGGRSMVGACTQLNEARIALDVGKEAVWFNNPFLLDTRAEMALPLALGGEVIGALTVQSVEEAAFSDEDVSSLQAMADQLAVALQNARLHRQNDRLFKQAARRATLLQAGAEVSRNITSILDMDTLLSRTVDIICDEYGFYYAGIFLIETLDNDEKWAVLKAGRGVAGRTMIEKGHKLIVGGNSMIGAATSLNEARIALDVGREAVWFNNPFLSDTRSEMALPLRANDRSIGALTVQSVEEAAFSEEDISSLQMMADQLAVAINNAQLLLNLEKASEELMRTRTFETIATATGETIHWVGNKAAPIPGCIERAREDFSRFLCIAAQQLAKADEATREYPLSQFIIQNSQTLLEVYPDLEAQVNRLTKKPLKKLQLILNVGSVMEDLEIVEKSALAILEIKENLIGPARRRKKQAADIVKIIKDSIRGLALPQDAVSYNIDSPLPPVYVDSMEIERVIINLVKNAMEAMDDQPAPHILISLHQEGDEFIVIDIADNGCGIPGEELTNIWLTFHTSKAKKGGTGLGLPACLQAMERMGGKIGVSSQPGEGATFTLHVPLYRS